MIKCENGTVKIEGVRPHVLAELQTLVHAMHYHVFVADHGLSADESRKLILRAVENGFKTEEELKQKAVEMTKQLLEEVLDDLKEILTGKDDE